MQSTTSWDNSERVCEWCLETYIPTTNWQKNCGYKCGYHSQNAKKPKKINLGNCARCAKTLLHKRQDAIYCSKTCKSMDHTFKHRPKTRPVGIARRQEIYKRDKGLCYLCLRTLDNTGFHLDHLVPVSRGGDSSAKNLAVCCPFCNRSRGSRIEEAQLRKLLELR